MVRISSTPLPLNQKPLETGPYQPIQRRTTVLRMPQDTVPAYLKPPSRLTEATAQELLPPPPAAPIPLLSVDALRARMGPGVRTEVMPAHSISYTPLGARAFVSAGTGGPTVLFEAGLGHGKNAWGRIFNEISAINHAVAYDRAGYGQSERSRQPRDGLQILRELRALLQTEEIKPPYVLVGHSLGGTIVKLFAKTYPHEVAGVVLVDARHAEFSKRCKQLGVHRMWYEPPALLFAMAPSAMRAEMASAALTERQVRRAGEFPPVPLIVLSQDRSTSRWPESIGKVWDASQRNMAKMSRLGRMKVVGDSGHNIHRDQPDTVTTAILSVIAAARYALAKSKI